MNAPKPPTNHSPTPNALTQEFCLQLMDREIPLRFEFVQSGASLGDLPPSAGLEVAIVGRSNVGKSSLLNFIAGQKQLARVSSTPGRTQLINYFSAEKGKFHLVDLPGFGYAESPKDIQAHWAREMARYFQARQSLIGVLFLVDCRRQIGPEDIDLCQWFLSLNLKVLAVQTKTDKLNKSQLTLAQRSQAKELGLAPGQIVSTSAEKKQGLKKLFAGLAGMLMSALPDESADEDQNESE